MKVFLMHRTRDVDLNQEGGPNESALIEDLELATLFQAMSGGDKFLLSVVQKAVLSGVAEIETIMYRQDVLRDCLDHPAIVREIYDLAVAALDGERRIYRSVFSRSPDALLQRSVSALHLLLVMLRRLRHLSDQHAGQFRSEGFTALFAMLTGELDDNYLSTVEEHLRQLRFRAGIRLSAELGPGHKAENYVLRQSQKSKEAWMKRIAGTRRLSHAFEINQRDEHGWRALSELQGRGVNPVANALTQSTDHVLSFFQMLRLELGFYIGCLNLHGGLVEKGSPTCFPLPADSRALVLSFAGLYDVGLALSIPQRVVGSDGRADGKQLVLITGANRGGKSTFLRSVGLAQLMMQAGMFVAAEAFRSSLCVGLFTHFRRDEDVGMNSGKLDEELSRMGGIADVVTPGCMILLNESFSATNEREGSEIARQIVSALLERRIRVLFVTHLFDLAHGYYTQQLPTALFLRAERQADGVRTFRLVEGEPLPTSYGEDLYRQIFNTDEVPANVRAG